MAELIQDVDIRCCIRALHKLEEMVEVYHILPQSVKG